MKKKHRKKYILFKVMIPFLMISFLLALFHLERQLEPALKEISHMQCRALANQIIDEAMTEILQGTELSEQELLIQSNTDTSYQANTALVNEFCALLSSDLTEGLNSLPKEVIHIPLGAATNLTYLANMGPKIPFTLLPMGNVKVDYETDFISVGINQINYKIWLDISMELRVVNPLYQETLLMERKIMLADLIFGGKVPEHYFQMTQPVNE